MPCCLESGLIREPRFGSGDELLRVWPSPFCMSCVLEVNYFEAQVAPEFHPVLPVLALTTSAYVDLANRTSDTSVLASLVHDHLA